MGHSENRCPVVTLTSCAAEPETYDVDNLFAGESAPGSRWFRRRFRASPLAPRRKTNLTVLIGNFQNDLTLV